MAKHIANRQQVIKDQNIFDTHTMYTRAVTLLCFVKWKEIMPRRNCSNLLRQYKPRLLVCSKSSKNPWNSQIILYYEFKQTYPSSLYYFIWSFTVVCKYLKCWSWEYPQNIFLWMADISVRKTNFCCHISKNIAQKLNT